VSRELIVTEPADDDINLYIARLNERNPDAARRFLRALAHAFDRLLSLPQVGHVWEEAARPLTRARATE